MSKLTRRGLLKGAAAAAGAAIGARALGPLGRALAAPEPAHFVHIFFNGGLNALFSANANLLAGPFGMPAADVMNVGNGVYTDAKTFGTFPAFAKEHWAAVGMRHGSALHTTPQNLRSGGERFIIMDGAESNLTKLAHAMGGDSPLKAVYFGDRAPAYQAQRAYQGVSIQRVSDLGDAIKALGAGGAPDPSATNRALVASSLETSELISKRHIDRNPTALVGLGEAYDSAIEALKKPAPKPVTFAEINTAYGLGGRTSVGSYAAMCAGAEVMIRAASTNVINITDFGLASWDFHQLSGGRSQNFVLSRQKFQGTGPFGDDRIAPIRTLLSRVLNMPDRNVVVCISGELVRLTNGDHGDGTVAVLFGKYVKTGVSFGVNAQSRFAQGTPGVKGFWAAAAAALRVPGQPFGANPHASLIL